MGILSPRMKDIYERYCFNKRNQDTGESMESYASILTSLAVSCHFGTLKDMIRDWIVFRNVTGV